MLVPAGDSDESAHFIDVRGVALDYQKRVDGQTKSNNARRRCEVAVSGRWIHLATSQQAIAFQSELAKAAE